MPNKASWIFLISVVLYLGGSIALPLLAPDMDALLLVTIIQAVSVLLPACVGAALLGKGVVGLRLPKFRDIALVALVALGMIWITGYCNIINGVFAEWLGLKVPGTGIPDLLPSQLPVGIAAIALLPGFGEELLFRGVIMGANRSRGISAIFVSAALFALMHVQPHNLFTYFVMGVILAAVAYRTQSIVLPMVLHALNNAIALALTVWVSAVSPGAGDDAMATMMSSGPIFIIVWVFYNLLAFAGVAMIWAIVRKMRDYGPWQPPPQPGSALRWPAALWVSFALLAGVNVLTFVTMFLP